MMIERIDDANIDRLANEAWYVSSRASQNDRFTRCLCLLQADNFQPDVIWDVGCAHGQFSCLLARHFADRGCHITGIDINQQRITENQQGNTSIPGLTFRCENFLQDSVSEKPVDLITALEVLYYFTPEQQQQFFQQAETALRSGGRLLISANIFFTSHISEQTLLELIGQRFLILRTDKIFRNLYYRFELPLIKLLDHIRYLEKLRIFTPNILRLNRKFYPGRWNAILLRPSKFIDNIILPGLTFCIFQLLESKLIYQLITGLTRLFYSRKGQSQLIILAEKP